MVQFSTEFARVYYFLLVLFFTRFLKFLKNLHHFYFRKNIKICLVADSTLYFEDGVNPVDFNSTFIF